MSDMYFELMDDLELAGRWYLNRLPDRRGVELDSREFRYGRWVDISPPLRAKRWKDGAPVVAEPPLCVMLDPKRSGTPLDFTFTNADMPVVTHKVADIIAMVAGEDVQLIPTEVEGRNEMYDIVNVVSLLDCIDPEHSEIQWYVEGNLVRPDKAGQPEMITKLVIDPIKVGAHHICRVKGWEIAVIVSDALKCALENARVSGIRFKQASL